MFKNWEYVVLSQVCTLSGLSLVEPIDIRKIVETIFRTQEIHRKCKMKRNKSDRKKRAIAQLNWLQKCAAMGNDGKTSMQWKTMMVANAIQHT